MNAAGDPMASLGPQRAMSYFMFISIRKQWKLLLLLEAMTAVLTNVDGGT